jgi:AP-2 complex subunit beta-1
MSYIALPNVIQALKDPLRQSLRDRDPYVRKTAAMCVAKVYVQDPHVVLKEGLFDLLRELVADSNPTVVSSAVVSLLEISDRSDQPNFSLNFHTATKLVHVIGDCSE